MKKLSLLFLTVMLGMGVFAQTTYSWRGEATNGNWNDANNWWNGSTALPTGGDILSFGNNNQLTMTNDLAATNRYQIIFTNYASESRIITGTTENTFNKNGSNKPKIENNSSANQTIDFPLKWEYSTNSAMELKPVSGDLTITKAINNNGIWTDVLGGNGKTLSIASMSGTGGLSIKNNPTTVKITGTSTYTGITHVNSGTLELQADLSSAEIFVYSGAKLIINGNDVDVQKLTINSGGTVEVLPGKSLTVNGVLTNNGILTLKSDANGTATIKTLGTVTNGATNYKVEQYLASQRNWYMSSPVAAAARPNSPDYANVESYNETTNAWVEKTSGALEVGRGYVIYPNATVPKTLTFTGTLNTGDKIIGLTRTAANTTYQGFNLVGNPYPSYLNIDNLQNNTDIVQSVWYRAQNASNTYVFDTYNIPSELSTGLSGKAVTKFIPPMQAFWLRVAAEKTSATVNFLNANRGHIDNTNNVFRAPQAVANQILRLQLTNGTATDETVLYFNANATDGYDAYDSPKMLNNGNTVPNLYTTVGTEKLVINGMNAIPYNVELPLSLQGAAGTYTITASEFSNFAEGDKVQLIDNGIPTDLTPGSSYTFSIAAGENTTGRFSVVFPKSGVPTGVDNAGAGDVTVFTRSSRIVVTANEAAQGSMIYVFNGVGQRLAAQAVSGTVNEIGRTFPAGVYVVKVNNTTAKVVVK